MAAGRLPPFVPSRPRPIVVDGRVVVIAAKPRPVLEFAVPAIAPAPTPPARGRVLPPVVHERRALPHPFRAPTPKPAVTTG